MEYLKFLKWITPGFTLALFEGEDGAGGNENKGGETVSKADFDKVTGERDKLTKDMDDVRGEVFTPEYMAFLDAKDKPAVKPEEEKVPGITDDQFEKMSKKDILELATKNAVAKIQTTLDADKKSAKTQSEASVQREIARFAKEHTDYEKYRPAMYGLSLKPENNGLSLQALYEKSKEYGKSLQEEPTEAEKKKQVAMSGMKPEVSSGTYSFDKKVDGDTAAKEAAEETAEKLGPIPSA